MTVLAGLDVAGDAEAWRDAGFTVDDDGVIRAGHLRMQTGVGERGIGAWHLASAADDVEPAEHPNTTLLLDHLVVFTDDPDRTTLAYAGLGLEARRVRDVGNGTTQTFFRAGEVIIELVGPIPDMQGERFWGLSFTVADLDACAGVLGDALGAAKDAVQPGRQIATLRHKAVGLTVPIAFMSRVTDVRLVTMSGLPYPDADITVLTPALTKAGLHVDVADWRDPSVDWAGARLTLLRSPWNYVDAVEEFVAWVRRVGAVSELWNPPELVEWNVHKSYLLDLEARGAPIVPTVILLHGTAASLDGICDAGGWNAVVLKPAVGSGAKDSARFDVGDAAGQAHLDTLLQAGDALVQPFLASVLSDGELSVMLVDGSVSHAVRKLPPPRDYRVQEEWGGTSALVEPADGAAELAARVVAALPTAALYARIDLLRHNDLWRVIEAEVIEPALWLNHAPVEATDRIVNAVMSRLG